jgi:hypothetical protein
MEMIGKHSVKVQAERQEYLIHKEKQKTMHGVFSKTMEEESLSLKIVRDK